MTEKTQLELREMEQVHQESAPEPAPDARFSPELQGTPRQVKWAKAIRHAFKAQLREFALEAREWRESIGEDGLEHLELRRDWTEITQCCTGCALLLEHEVLARWWIDYRVEVESFLKHMAARLEFRCTGDLQNGNRESPLAHWRNVRRTVIVLSKYEALKSWA